MSNIQILGAYQFDVYFRPHSALCRPFAQTGEKTLYHKLWRLSLIEMLKHRFTLNSRFHTSAPAFPASLSYPGQAVFLVSLVKWGQGWKRLLCMTMRIARVLDHSWFSCGSPRRCPAVCTAFVLPSVYFLYHFIDFKKNELACIWKQ